MLYKLAAYVQGVPPELALPPFAQCESEAR